MSIISSQPLVWVSAFCDLEGQPSTLTPGDCLLDSFVRNWVTCTCLSVDMHFTNGVHPTKPLKARSRSPLWISPDCFFALPLPPRCHIERPCSSTLPFFHQTPQKSQISLQFPVQCLFGRMGARGRGGVRRAVLKKSLTHKQFGPRLEGKHVQEGYVKRVVKGLRIVCSGADTQIPPRRGHRMLCSGLNRRSLVNIPLLPHVCSTGSALCWRAEDMTRGNVRQTSEVNIITSVAQILQHFVLVLKQVYCLLLCMHVLCMHVVMG